jgi:RNA polymerase sigma-70 factor (ECF subfamily)
MLLHGARGKARQDSAGRLVAFDEQDRSLWDAAPLEEAKGLLAGTGSEQPGPYQLQAAIALLHAVAPDGDAVQWRSVARLYAALQRVAPSPAVR